MIIKAYKSINYLFLLFSLLCCSKLYATQKDSSTIVVDKNQNQLFEEMSEACFQGDSQKIEQWIKSGGDINLGKDNLPLIWSACMGGHLDIIKALIQAGADLEFPSLGNKLIIAVCSDLLSKVAEKTREQEKNKFPNRKTYPKNEIVKILIDAGVNVKVRNKRGKTALHAACSTGSLDVIKMLIKAGADVNLIGDFGNTPLHNASMYGDKEIVKILFSSDISSSINVRNEFKETPLFIACRNGFIDIVEILIKSGADVLLFDRQGLTPLHVASLNGHINIIKLLVANNANIHARDIKNLKPLDYFGSNNQEIRKMLGPLPS